MPISRVMVRAISSVRALSPSWIFFSNSARRAGGVAAQASNARRAEAIAASASAAVPCGIRASNAPSVGECTSMLPLPAGATHGRRYRTCPW
jgi:hypothetical protein